MHYLSRSNFSVRKAWETTVRIVSPTHPNARNRRQNANPYTATASGEADISVDVDRRIDCPMLFGGRFWERFWREPRPSNMQMGSSVTRLALFRSCLRNGNGT